jgi:hypothetical protein
LQGAASSAAVLGERLAWPTAAAGRSSAEVGSARPATGKLQSAPRLFCTAYITPDAKGQGGQEHIVARYPLALVPQDTGTTFVTWRDRVRQLNPSIALLAYQMVIEETGVPGPGHDEMRKVTANGAFCVYPGGLVPTVMVPPQPQPLRIFDPRNPEFAERLLEACRTVLRSYPYDGLFLDQCTVYTKAHPYPAVRAEMRQALQKTLLKLRTENPNSIIVGNSSFHWDGLNGELVEARPDDVDAETQPYAGHAAPRVVLVQALLKDPTDRTALARQMRKAHAHGAFFGAAVDYQHALWFDLFDEVLASGTRST